MKNKSKKIMLLYIAILSYMLSKIILIPVFFLLVLSDVYLKTNLEHLVLDYSYIFDIVSVFISAFILGINFNRISKWINKYLDNMFDYEK